MSCPVDFRCAADVILRTNLEDINHSLLKVGNLSHDIIFRSFPKEYSICQPRAGNSIRENPTSYSVPLERREETLCLFVPYWVQDEQPRKKGNLNIPDVDGDSLLPRALALDNEHGDANLLLKRSVDPITGFSPSTFTQASFHSGYARQYGKRLFWNVEPSSERLENQECCCPPLKRANT